MCNLYYIQYNFIDPQSYEIYPGEMYIVDTGFGILELGSIDDNIIYEDLHLSHIRNLDYYMQSGPWTQDYTLTKVL